VALLIFAVVLSGMVVTPTYSEGSLKLGIARKAIPATERRLNIVARTNNRLRFVGHLIYS